MSLINTIKKSLGFEVTESDENANPNIMDSVRNFVGSFQNSNSQQNTQQQFNNTGQAVRNVQQNYGNSTQRPAYEEFNDYVITPEQSFYEIVLIRPKTIDDINYVVDQILEEKNPVILDLSFLEKESVPNFRLAGDKIKQLRVKYGAQALLLEHSEEKNLVILSPKKVKVINKG